MKNVRIFALMGVAVLIGLTSCQESDDLSASTIEGTYRGSLTYDSNLKSTLGAGIGSSDATAEVSDLGDGQIEVHCFGDVLDTTFVLNYYENQNMIMVCLDGTAFESMYGHMMGMGGMHGNNNHNGETMHNNNSSDWMNHMNWDHNDGDEHFGGFNMTDHTFDYTMQTELGDYHFQGTKKR
jgi:hypothetical protein